MLEPKYRKIIRYAPILLWLLTAGTLSFVVAAKETTPIDAVLLMDSSGSMKQNDPERLREPAAKLFISLLGDQDRVAVVSFSDNGYPVSGLIPATGARNRTRLFRAVDRVSARGAFTNLSAAVDVAATLLDKSADTSRRRMIVFLSDGAMDTGDPGRDQELTALLREKTAPDLAGREIEVHSIAFTSKSDVGLMHGIAEQTNGLFRIANSDADLHEVFATIFENARQPDMLPLQNGVFHVDKSISEVNLVASKGSPNDHIELQAPDGSRFGSGNRPAGVRWFSTPAFDLVTLTSPGAGAWKLLSSNGQDRAYIVTNLGLEGRVTESESGTSEARSIEGWLSRDGEIESHPDLLAQLKIGAHISDEDGNAVDLQLTDTGLDGDVEGQDAVYSRRLETLAPGAYQVDLLAAGPAFERKKTLFVTIPVAARPVEPAEPVPAATVAEEKATPEIADDSVAEVAGNPEQQPQGLSRRDILGVILMFLVGNLLIGMIGGLVWFVLRKKNAKVEDESEDAAPAAA